MNGFSTANTIICDVIKWLLFTKKEHLGKLHWHSIKEVSGVWSVVDYTQYGFFHWVFQVRTADPILFCSRSPCWRDQSSRATCCQAWPNQTRLTSWPLSSPHTSWRESGVWPMSALLSSMSGKCRLQTMWRMAFELKTNVLWGVPYLICHVIKAVDIMHCLQAQQSTSSMGKCVLTKSC